MSLPVIAGALDNCADIDLQGVSVYVRAARNDIGQIVADWLNRWGARAQVLPAAVPPDNSAILLDLDPDQPLTVPWAGERVLATESGRSQPQRTGRGWEVNAYDIRAIGRTLMQIAHGHCAPDACQCGALCRQPGIERTGR
jgi:hypothetical protein